MKGITIKIKRTTGDKREIKAYGVNEFFAVHRHVLPDGDQSRRLWTVTHIPTGMVAGGFLDSRAHAVAVANRLHEIPIDWAIVNETDNTEQFEPHRDALRAAVLHGVIR